MEKVKKFLLSFNITTVLLVMVVLRVVAVGADIGVALSVLSICALQGFYRWVKMQEQEPVNEKLARELSDIKAAMSTIVLKNSIKPPVSPSTGEMPGIKRFF